MSSKTFLTISKQESLMVYKNVLDNSDKKWESGINLSNLEDYGGATSLAIISIEELVKALLILLDGKGFEIRNIKGIYTFFENHQIRYIIAYSMFVFGVFGEELLNFVKILRDNPQQIKEIVKDKSYLVKKYKFLMLRKAIHLKKEFDWFSNVDIFRQDGFYCDYQEQLKNPIEITSEDYEKVYHRLDKARMVGKVFIEILDSNDELLNEQIKQLQRELKKTDFYDNIGETLTKIRKNRENPFDTIKKRLSNNE